MPVDDMHLKPVNADMALKGKVYESLKSAITAMDIYADGADRKLDERRLAEELGVSRTPVREALTLLEKDGLVQMIPRRGAFVVRKSKQEILELICVLGALESLAARLASTQASNAEIAELRETFVTLDDAKGAVVKIDEYSGDNIRFHQAIIRLSKCDLLAEIAAGLFVHMRVLRSRSIKAQDRETGSVVDHLYLIEALERRDAELAEKLVREHTDHLSEHVRNYVHWVE